MDNQLWLSLARELGCGYDGSVFPSRFSMLDNELTISRSAMQKWRNNANCDCLDMFNKVGASV
jgi:hypothetical protein